MDVAITNGIEISVEAFYQAVHSNVEQCKYVHAYRIKITNLNPFDVQLLERHWDIWDSSSQLKVVDGEGVIGEQPIIKSNDYHEYMSWCPLTTDLGYMSGYYRMVNVLTQEDFLVQIPRFRLMADFRKN